MRFVVLAGVVVASLAVPAVARAAGPAFGGAGQLAISDDQPLGGVVGVAGVGPAVPTGPTSSTSASFQFATLSNGGGSGTEFALAPAADYFVIPNLSVGGNILFGIVSPPHGNGGTGSTATLFGIAPRVGYNIPFTDMISFWPKLYFAYATASSSSGGTSAGLNSASIGIYAPFMFVPAQHFFLGIGPDFSTQLSNNTTGSEGGKSESTSEAKATEIGLQATVGGWFLGD